jgi:hypothetical protein
VIRRPDDTTFVQFHDLAVSDPEAAWAQAKPGLERMGYSPIGGWALTHVKDLDRERVGRAIGGALGEHLRTTKPPDIAAKVGGLYRPDVRTLDIVVPQGNAVEQQHMLHACELRLFHRLTKPTVDRIDTIAYVFIDKADAYANLHELWLRELECWYIDGHGKHRIDDNYRPTPKPPDWVKVLNDREPIP